MSHRVQMLILLIRYILKGSADHKTGINTSNNMKKDIKQMAW